MHRHTEGHTDHAGAWNKMGEDGNTSTSSCCLSQTLRPRRPAVALTTATAVVATITSLSLARASAPMQAFVPSSRRVVGGNAQPPTAQRSTKFDAPNFEPRESKPPPSIASPIPFSLGTTTTTTARDGSSFDASSLSIGRIERDGIGEVTMSEDEVFVIVDDVNEEPARISTMEELELLPKVAMREKSLALELDVDLTEVHDHPRPTVVGHRGSLYHELENTLRSFQTSHEIGCDAIELDVFLLKCGELVVFHGGGTDENPGCLRDYCGLEGRSILDFTAEQARTLRFNPYYDEFGCGPDRILKKHELGIAYIPTLREVLTTLKEESDLDVKIELKGDGTPEPTLELVEELDMVDRCHFSSFDHSRIKTIRQLRPELKSDGSHKYRTGALFLSVPPNFLELALEAGASEVHLQYDTVNSARIRSIHDAGLDSMAWFRGPIGMKEDVRDKYWDVGNEDEDMYRTVLASGVRSLCCNRPDVLVGMVGRRRRERENSS